MINFSWENHVEMPVGEPHSAQLLGQKVPELCPFHVLSYFSYVRLFATLWSVACQAPLCMGFSRQEYWNGLLCPPPGDLPKPGIEPMSPVSPELQVGS